MSKKFFMPTANYGISSQLLQFGYVETKEEEEADFFMFTGGSDVSASLYGQKDYVTSYPEPARDLREVFYVTKAKLLGKWSIGICRGFQLLNVMAGISLIQHLVGHTNSIHSVERAVNLPAPAIINSSHHQAVPASAALDLRYDKYLVCKSFVHNREAEQEFLEGGVCSSHKFAGVQYHPEYANCPEAAVNLFKDMIKGVL